MGRERGRTRNVIFDKEKNTLRQQPFYGHSTAIRLPFYGNSTAILRQFYGGPRVVVISKTHNAREGFVKLAGRKNIFSHASFVINALRELITSEILL